MTELEQAIADKDAIEKALKDLVAFIDPRPPAPPVLKLAKEELQQVVGLLREAYRCLWSEHPGASNGASNAT